MTKALTSEHGNKVYFPLYTQMLRGYRPVQAL